MQKDGAQLKEDAPRNAADQSVRPAAVPVKRSIFAVPAPVERVFKKFPLVTYEASELPLRTPKHRWQHYLHVFTTVEDGRKGRPSFNPGCLKWQAYLKFCDIHFQPVSSSNHASPSGALPFLLPANTGAEQSQPISSNKLKKWAAQQTSDKEDRESLDVRYEAYASLLDSRIRKAWLYQLYLIHENFEHVAGRLYIQPCSSNMFVGMAIAYQLRKAAETELTKSAAVIDEQALMQEAAEAIEALSTLLGNDKWFFGQPSPSLFDASIFAYTHLILDRGMQWSRNPLQEALDQYQNLVDHRNRILEKHFS